MDSSKRNRFIEIKNFSSQKFLKIDFADESYPLSKIESISFLLTLSGFNIFDIFKNFEKLKALENGVFKGLNQLKNLNKEIQVFLLVLILIKIHIWNVLRR